MLWDSHPLALGATPKQVIIDGILQFPDAHTLPKPVAHQRPPNTPGFEKETAETLKYDGLPPLKSKPHHNVVAFTNVSSFWTPDRSGSISDLFSKQLSPAREEAIPRYPRGRQHPRSSRPQASRRRSIFALRLSPRLRRLRRLSLFYYLNTRIKKLLNIILKLEHILCIQLYTVYGIN